MHAQYSDPTTEELSSKEELVGARITIYWDGDDAFYPCRVIEYAAQDDKHVVLYEKDSSGVQYPEDLRSSTWKIWRRSDEEYAEMLDAMGMDEPANDTIQDETMAEEEPPADREAHPSSHATTSHAKKAKQPTYAAMVMEAVAVLNEKEGSSLQAIRKYIRQHYNIAQSQIASFHNLTLKAINKAVATKELEKIKHSYTLSAVERERRKEAERQARIAAGLPPELRRELSSRDLSRKSTPFIVDAVSLSSLALSHNKLLRKELLDLRNKRDKFLKKRMQFLKPFLPEKDYFMKKDQYHKTRRAEKKAAKQIAEKLGYAPPLTLPADEDTDIDDEEEETGDSAIPVPPPQSSSSMDVVPALPSADNVIATEEAEEVDEEVKLTYSTIEGVSLLPKPSILQADLHEHQVLGISWMVHMFKQGMPMILGDQMGLGKTLQTIGFLAQLHEREHKKGPHLIVVPLSVLSNWLSEIERFCPSFRAVRFHGPKSERERIKNDELRDLTEFDIVVTTYEILVSEVNFFKRKYVWTTVVVDEGHRLKNEKSQLSEKLRSVPCLSKVLLTGTPLQNNLHELWALLYFLAPDIFSESSLFDEGFDLMRGVIDNEVLRQARRLLSVFMLRRVKEQVNFSLPSRREITLLVSLTGQQTELYKEILCGLDASTIEVVMKDKEGEKTLPATAVLTDAANTNGEGAPSSSTPTALVPLTSTKSVREEQGGSKDSDWRKLMNILLQLRKICNHTYLLPHIAPEPYEITEEIVQGSGKLLMLDRMLPPLRQDGHRVLIFSQFTSMLDILEDYCELREYPFVRLDGETNRVQRRLDVRRFNAPNSPLFIFLISTRAGGLGLNLASADTVILYDSDWNPQVDLQAMERVHRIGQTKPVRIFRLVCRGSVEERMVSRAEKKLFLNAMVAEIDPDEELSEHAKGKAKEDADNEISEALGIGGSTMSKAELASLIRFGANAIFESESTSTSQQISDEELDRLLERQGRDETVEPPLSMRMSKKKDAQGEEGEAAASEDAEHKQAEIDLALQKAQQQLKERMETLQEVDLRQLGNLVFTKKKEKRRKSDVLSSTTTAAAEVDEMNDPLEGLDPLSAALAANPLILTEKRVRKERIVMVDGRGTGYGGAVPILASTMEESEHENSDNEPEGDTLHRRRGRQWRHRHFCTLCGIGDTVSPTPDLSSFTKCAHCPFIFHTQCGEKIDLFAGKGPSGMYICPHHRCCECYRPTASAGGLLFRCLGCLCAYCEDCLPQDEIESVGRCRDLEVYGYQSKQAYYIKCPSCCAIEGITAQGVLGNAQHKVQEKAEGEEGDVEGEGEGEQEKQEETAEAEVARPAVDLSSVIRIQWKEVIPPPPSPSKKSNKSKKRTSSAANNGSSKKKKVKAEEEVEDDEEEEIGETKAAKYTTPSGKKKSKKRMLEEAEETESNGEEEDFDDAHPEVPSSCSLSAGLELVMNHAAFKKLLELAQDENIDADQELAMVIAKIEAGRYRSPNLFLSDIQYVVEGHIVKIVLKAVGDSRSAKTRVANLANALITFLKVFLGPNLKL